jgi:hypothetical protein
LWRIVSCLRAGGHVFREPLPFLGQLKPSGFVVSARRLAGLDATFLGPAAVLVSERLRHVILMTFEPYSLL